MSAITRRYTSEEALERLLAGNERFVSGKLEHPNHCEESRRAVSSGQTPLATVLTCADSRVPPVDVFDLGLGDLFVVRVAGNIVGDHILGSIEYAAEHLNTPLVVVMSHSCCGAVTAVASGARIGGHIATLIPPIESAIKKVKNCEGDLVDNASKELAVATAKKIAESEPIMSDLVKTGSVKVVPAFYDFHSGRVTFLTSRDLCSCQQ